MANGVADACELSIINNSIRRIIARSPPVGPYPEHLRGEGVGEDQKKTSTRLVHEVTT
jgi:hypothetical protein